MAFTMKSKLSPEVMQLSVAIEDRNRLQKAGDALAEAAHRVSSTYDGVHRLRLALAGWYQALADEGRRGEKAENTP